jgi:hypothetical protein
LEGIKSMARADSTEGGDPGFVIETAASIDLREDVFKIASSKNWPVLGLQQRQLSLEEVFRALTQL